MTEKLPSLLPTTTGEPKTDSPPAAHAVAPGPRRSAHRHLSLPSLLGYALVAYLGFRCLDSVQLALVEVRKPEVPLPGGNSTGVNWAPCPGRENQHYQCGFIDVPTDYDDPSRGWHRLALSRIPARVSEKERLGSLFVNPGGPGGSGYDMTFRFPLDELLEGRYDVVGFDPRGIGRSTPVVNCFPSPEAYTAFKAHTVLSEGYSIPPAGQRSWEAFLDQTKEMRALKEAEFSLCADKFGEELWFMGTSSVVKDIERMSAVLEGEDAPINYWGGSYGTILGAYLVNIVDPRKIGRVVIDGVASSPQWADSPPDLMLYDWLNSTEDTYAWFLRGCASAGPSACALALESDTDPAGVEIEQRLERYLDKLWEAPRAVITPDGNAGVLRSSLARARLYQSTNGPRSWPAIATLFAKAIFDDDPVPLYEFAHASPTTGTRQSELSRVAVGCADGPPTKREDGLSAEAMAKEMVRVLEGASPHFGGSVSLIEPDGQCEFWPQRMDPPKGFRFTGPWNATLETPMLIISNTADPITPLSSGIEINDLMGNSSRLVIQDSPGHCSLGSVSVCTSTYIKRYLLEGTIPKDMSTCAIDQGFFPTPGSEATLLPAEMTDAERKALGVAQRASAKWDEWLRASDDV